MGGKDVEPVVKVTKYLPKAAGEEAKNKRLLQQLRAVVREAKEEHPELAHYQLYDVSFLPRRDQVEVTLYFQS